jgi:hypothetical protein
MILGQYRGQGKRFTSLGDFGRQFKHVNGLDRASSGVFAKNPLPFLKSSII